MVERRQSLVTTVQEEVLVELFPHAVHLSNDVRGLDMRRKRLRDSENQLGEESRHRRAVQADRERWPWCRPEMMIQAKC